MLEEGQIEHSVSAWMAARASVWTIVGLMRARKRTHFPCRALTTHLIH